MAKKDKRTKFEKFWDAKQEAKLPSTKMDAAERLTMTFSVAGEVINEFAEPARRDTIEFQQFRASDNSLPQQFGDILALDHRLADFGMEFGDELKASIKRIIR